MSWPAVGGTLAGMNANLPTQLRELHSRTNNGIHVRLLWGPDDGRLAVSVDDTKTGDRFAFDVPERHRALHAFAHPFSYASALGELAA